MLLFSVLYDIASTSIGTSLAYLQFYTISGFIQATRQTEELQMVPSRAKKGFI